MNPLGSINRPSEYGILFTIDIPVRSWSNLSMKQFLKSIPSRFGVASELFQFLWERKLWWLIPLILVLVVVTGLFIFATATGLGPFVYTLW